MNPADTARANGWTVGTRLAGDEGFSETVIQITAVGESHVLAKSIARRGQPCRPYESSWTFDCRDWRVVPVGRGLGEAQ